MLCIAGFALLVNVVSVDAQARDLPPIEDYYSLCAHGTDAELFSWHGINQDGKPPVDMSRQAFHFLCEGKRIYAPAGGTVWGATLRFGSIILIDDPVHDACMVFLGMESIAVGRGDVVEAGTYLGDYRWVVHFAALDAPCDSINWYDFDARQYERPVAFIEIGYVIAPDMQQDDAIPFVSQNPGGRPAVPAALTNPPVPEN